MFTELMDWSTKLSLQWQDGGEFSMGTPQTMVKESTYSYGRYKVGMLYVCKTYVEKTRKVAL